MMGACQVVLAAKCLSKHTKYFDRNHYSRVAPF
jgi:hypothetical protein